MTGKTFTEGDFDGMKNLFLTAVICISSLWLACDLQAGTDSRRNQMLMLRAKQDECSSNLKNFYSSLKLYAALNQGNLPEKNNFAGLNELTRHGITYSEFYCKNYRGKKYKYKAKESKKNKERRKFTEANSPYIYFGGINLNDAVNSTPKLVIMCDKPNSRHLNVLLADGSVIKIESGKGRDKISNTADIVNALNKRYKYPAVIFQALCNKARSIDAELRKWEK